MARLVIGTSKAATTAGMIKEVPTVAPLCVQKAKDANGKVVNYGNPIDLDGATDIGEYVFYYAYSSAAFPANTSLDFSSLTTISGQYACFNMFINCTGIASVDFSSLASITNQRACVAMFYGCRTLTRVDFSSLTTINAALACSNMFRGCTGLTSVDLSSLTTISNDSSCYYMFYGCTSLTNVDLHSLISVGYSSATYMFGSCTSLTSVDLSSLTMVSGSNGVEDMFTGCTGLTSVTLPSLSFVSAQNACMQMFMNCAHLASLFFPALASTGFGSYTSQFYNIVKGVTGCTIHFPSNLQAKIETMGTYPNFGGTNTVVLFDLPATNTLTGADTNTYSRNPKYDTVTALAWKVGAYGTTNFTPAYYTSGTTDPTVGTTIYSDAACTTSVTTVTAIA